MKTNLVKKCPGLAGAIFLVGLGGCVTMVSGPAATLPDVDSAAARVYIAQCGGCHAVPHPKRLNAEAWERLVRVMDRRRAERGYPALEGEQRMLVMKYLARHAR